MLCDLLLVLTRILTLFNGDMWYVIRYEGGFNLLAWCWNPPMVVVTVQGAPHRPLIAFRRGGHAMGMICYHSNASNGVFFFHFIQFRFCQPLGRPK